MGRKNVDYTERERKRERERKKEFYIKRGSKRTRNGDIET